MRAYWIAGFGALTVAVVGGLLTEIGPWYKALVQPSWKPPDWAFGPIWTVIFLLSAIAAAMSWNAAPDLKSKQLVLWAFIVNGALNVAWSLFYFKLQRPDWAMIEWVLLWLSVAFVVYVCFKMSTKAGLFVLPYLIWVTIAGFLNWATIRLNGPFS